MTFSDAENLPFLPEVFLTLANEQERNNNAAPETFFAEQLEEKDRSKWPPVTPDAQASNWIIRSIHCDISRLLFPFPNVKESLFLSLISEQILGEVDIQKGSSGLFL